jgi:hypothetical protein
MQLEAGLRSRGSSMKVEHIAETLLRGWREAPDGPTPKS